MPHATPPAYPAPPFPPGPETPIGRDPAPHPPRRTRLVGAYLLLCFAAQVWPVATLANRVEPRVLGMPFLMAWYVGGVFAVFLGLLALYRSGREDGGA